MFIISAIANYMKRRLEIEVAREELRKLDEHALLDIGITRREIDRMTDDSEPPVRRPRVPFVPSAFATSVGTAPQT